MVSGASVGSNPDIVSKTAAAIQEAVNVPVFVKLTPEGGRIADVAKACFDNGIASVGGTGNRLAIPDFDINNPEHGICHLQDEPTLACFSGPWLKPLALRDVYEMRKICNPDNMVMGSGGIEKWDDAVQMIMCGADFIQMRNLNIDPNWYLYRIDFQPRGEAMGIARLLEELKRRFPELRVGYFNPCLDPGA